MKYRLLAVSALAVSLAMGAAREAEVVGPERGPRAAGGTR
jgi:hypothetical protein